MRVLPASVVCSLTLVFAPACDPKSDPGSSGTGTSGSSTSTGGPDTCTPPSAEGDACTENADCALASDCCSCAAYAPGSSIPGNCGGTCPESKCESLGIVDAECLDGQCRPRGLSCNQATVTCDSLPPDCEPGTLPRVWAGCWAGGCLTAESCDWAPGCESCGADQICMQETRGGCDYARCVDNIPECGGAQTCACMGQTYCAGGTCTPTADGFSCG